MRPGYQGEEWGGRFDKSNCLQGVGVGCRYLIESLCMDVVAAVEADH
jgi:hypothetical protein